MATIGARWIISHSSGMATLAAVQAVFAGLDTALLSLGFTHATGYTQYNLASVATTPAAVGTTYGQRRYAFPVDAHSATKKLFLLVNFRGNIGRTPGFDFFIGYSVDEGFTVTDVIRIDYANNIITSDTTSGTSTTYINGSSLNYLVYDSDYSILHVYLGIGRYKEYASGTGGFTWPDSPALEKIGDSYAFMGRGFNENGVVQPDRLIGFTGAGGAGLSLYTLASQEGYYRTPAPLMVTRKVGDLNPLLTANCVNCVWDSQEIPTRYQAGIPVSRMYAMWSDGKIALVPFCAGIKVGFLNTEDHIDVDLTGQGSQVFTYTHHSCNQLTQSTYYSYFESYKFYRHGTFGKVPIIRWNGTLV